MQKTKNKHQRVIAPEIDAKLHHAFEILVFEVINQSQHSIRAAITSNGRETAMRTKISLSKKSSLPFTDRRSFARKHNVTELTGNQNREIFAYPRRATSFDSKKPPSAVCMTRCVVRHRHRAAFGMRAL